MQHWAHQTQATLGIQAKTGKIDTEDTCNIGHTRRWQHVAQKTQAILLYISY